MQVGATVGVGHHNGIIARRQIEQVLRIGAVVPLEGVRGGTGHYANVDEAVVKPETGHVYAAVDYPNTFVLKDDHGTRRSRTTFGIRHRNGVGTGR